MAFAPHFRPVAQACALLLLGLQSAQAQTTDAPQQTTLDTVVVTGIRHGIEDSIAAKRNASSIVEAISSEDIGKLPDVTVAESLGRLTGVTTQRNKANGKATDVSVRGMAPSFNGNLLNGREQASTSNARAPEFDLFPAELTSSVLVYKTPDATLIGQGLASTIDLRTIRPLDYGKRTLAVNVRDERLGVSSGAEVGSGHRGALIYVDQFADRTLGISLGLSSLREDNGNELIFDSWGGGTSTLDYNGQSAIVPAGFKYDTQHRKSSRDGATATLQYKPSANFKTTVDLLYSRGTDSTKLTGLEGAIAGSTGVYDPNGALTNATIVDGVATSGTISNYKGDVRNHLYANKDHLQSLGVNLDWKASEQWRWELDAGHSHGVKNVNNYETTAGQPGNTPASQLASISYTGFNGKNFDQVKYTPSQSFADRNFAVLTDVDGWGGGPATPQAGYLGIANIDDTVNSLRLTAHQEFEWGPLVGGHYGINFNKRDKSNLGDGGRLAIIGGDGYASMPVPGTGTALAGASGIPVVSFDPTGTLGSVYNLARWVDAATLARDWTVKEKITTAYVMGDLAGKLGSIPYTGNVGLQFVHSNQASTGNRVDLATCTGITAATCPSTVDREGSSYNNVLPSLNLTFDLGDQQQLRLGAAEQLARPDLDDMSAAINFGLPTGTTLQPALAGFAGNPQLKPYKAKALDLSYEKYFNKDGYVSVAGFYKKLDNYILNAPRSFDFAPFTSALTPLPLSGPYKGSTVGFLTQPTNVSGGNLYGMEFSLTVPLRMVSSWLDGFGATVNYSYSGSSIKLPTSGFVTSNNAPVFNGATSDIGLPGLSKNVVSARLFYEAHGFQLSWAAHRRSDFIGQILDYRSDSQLTFIKAETIVDAQVGYEFQGGWLKGLSVLLQGNNLSNAPFQEYTSDRNSVSNKVVYGKTYRLGLNYKY